MLKLVFNLFLFCLLLGLTNAGQETFEIHTLYEAAAPETLLTMSQSGHPLAVSVSNEDIVRVSSSVIKAETWLRTQVLSHFPALQITTIVVGNTIFCQNGNKNHNLAMVLPSVKNIYHSLTRWGLEKDIKVSAAFSSHCFHPNSPLFRDDDIVEKVTEPLLLFLHSINSTYSRNLTPLSDEMVKLESSHIELLKKFGSFLPNKVNVIITNPKQHNRKLIDIPIDPFPETSQPPLHSSIGFSVPSSIAKSPHPQVPPNSASPPSISLPFAPGEPPSTSPFSYLPPCNPADTPAPAAAGGGDVEELWCVAKPSVPAETLQEALDYACGEGGADCAEITTPHGNCFYPDSVFAHSSYAFNSYYQKHKRIGGTCSFGGTAMLITGDPSYLNCRFHLS
ncbi:glucan endo-1,3-beta-glucosidase 3 [Euphorbia lathyris]|uniref:glucan endo-1,3-beta-glucosidase 3 n=1 Tax=Euphorbia lathyris TaxID=212925 RepID=UPI0033144934